MLLLKLKCMVCLETCTQGRGDGGRGPAERQRPGGTGVGHGGAGVGMAGRAWGMAGRAWAWRGREGSGGTP